MKRNFIKSSALKSVGYDTLASILEVEFRSGSVYQYFDVPKYIYEKLFNVPSAGKYFAKNIAYGFRYERLDQYFDRNYRTQLKTTHFSQESLNMKEIYRKLAIKFHPDKVKGYEELMKEINMYRDMKDDRSLLFMARKHGVL